MKFPSLGDFTEEFYQTFQELIPMIHNLVQNIEEEEKLPNLFYKVSIILIQTPHKESTKKKIRQYAFMNQMQKSTYISKQNPAIYMSQKNNQDQWGLF